MNNVYWVVKHADGRYWAGMDHWFHESINSGMKYSSYRAAQAAVHRFAMDATVIVGTVWSKEWKEISKEEEQSQIFCENHKMKLGKNQC